MANDAFKLVKVGSFSYMVTILQLEMSWVLLAIILLYSVVNYSGITIYDGCMYFLVCNLFLINVLMFYLLQNLLHKPTNVISLYFILVDVNLIIYQWTH